MFKFRSRYHLQQIVRIARREASTGREICGLLTKTSDGLVAVQTRNKSLRNGSWSFYSADVRAVERQVSDRGEEIVGTFHSHPVGIAKPGPRDIATAPNNSLMLVIECIEGCAQLWRIKGGRASEVAFGVNVRRKKPRPNST